MIYCFLRLWKIYISKKRQQELPGRVFKFRPILGALNLQAVKFLYRATPTWDRFCPESIPWSGGKMTQKDHWSIKHLISFTKFVNSKIHVQKRSPYSLQFSTAILSQCVLHAYVWLWQWLNDFSGAKKTLCQQYHFID